MEFDMSDIFADIMEKVKNKNTDEPTKPPSTSENVEDGKGAEKSSSSKNSKSTNKDGKSKSDKSEKSEKSFDKLAEIMASGFSDLKEIFMNQNRNDEFDYPEYYYDEDEEIGQYELHSELDGTDGNDMFDDMANVVSGTNAVGHEIRPSLAALADKFLNMNLEESFLKEKKEKYLRPSNVQFLETPKVNKPVWENMIRSTRMRDSNYQNIQNDFLSSAVPVLKVMEQLFDAKDDLKSLDVKDLLDTLKDSLLLLGSANVGMIKMRRENIKKDLPKTMHGLCRESVAHSSTNLFGDHLNTSIKEVSELNRISNNFRPRGARGIGRFRGRGFPIRGRGRGMRQGTRGRGQNKRFHPYQGSEKKASNQPGPSKN